MESAWIIDPEHSPAVTRVVCFKGMEAQLGPAGLLPGVITSLLKSVAIPELSTQSLGHGKIIAARADVEVWQRGECLPRP